MEATNNGERDLEQIAAAVVKTNQQRRAMREAVAKVAREARLLRTHKGTVAGVLQALTRLDSLIARAPCVTHPAQHCP